MKICPVCQRRYPSESAFCFVDGSTLNAMDDPRIGATIAGRYVLEEILGEGGMATVYQARHKLVDRPCAIKILHNDVTKDPNVRERFRREARHAQRLAHPNIIEVFDQGETEDGTLFLVMEHLEGECLADVIARGPMKLSVALPLVIQMGRALARAHDFEVIHRDLKPENVFVMAGNRIKLLDFGIARSMQDSRLTSLGEIFGTPEYMAPEQGTSNDAGPSADLYSLGVIMYEMLTNTLPFEAQNAPTMLVKHMTEPPPRLRALAPDAPQELDDLIYSLMAKTPAERPVDAHRVLHALKEIAKKANIPLPAEPDGQDTTPSQRATKQVAVDDWQRRTQLFEKMLVEGFASPPDDLRRMLEALKTHVTEIDELRKKALEEQEKLEVVEAEGRDGRLRFGRAMDELAIDASREREEARALRVAIGPLSERSASFIEPMLAAHRDATFWEGRCGFAEPYKELSQAYRKLADIVDEWLEARKAERAAEKKASDTERMLVDVDYQIQELRSGLEHLDKSIEERREDSQKLIAQMGRRAGELEAELLHLATRFCAPLRAKPELGPLFRELEREGTRPGA
jgi:eukaryotic-like serine/threonine-protein kinase